MAKKKKLGFFSRFGFSYSNDSISQIEATLSDQPSSINVAMKNSVDIATAKSTAVPRTRTPDKNLRAEIAPVDFVRKHDDVQYISKKNVYIPELKASLQDYTVFSNQSLAAEKTLTAYETLAAVGNLDSTNSRALDTELPEIRSGFFTRLKNSLMKTRQNLGSGFIKLFSSKKIDNDLFEALEEQLLVADVDVNTTRKIINSLIEYANHRHIKDTEVLYSKLREEMAAILTTVERPLVITGKLPFIILMVGVNGVGKTTTIGKLAHQYQSEGKSLMLAAGDTFRAAAIEQLQVWGERNNIPVIAQHTGADAASVIFDAIQAAKAHGIDILIADTAGRLQNKTPLMEELKKIVRVIKKQDVNASYEIMLIIDACTGQNSVIQTNLFHNAVGLTGIALTKLDGTAKGGVIFSIAERFNIPIRYIGVGEGIDDLQPFKAHDFIEALFAREN
ncbi:signal recognition particle-docking protein FtsY [Candidatus Hoaglandella endobia]|uniref:Signal recognition particle receptor FtsY n=1 Tax=Candidatus Hoaglandella endobia TaxID=1778263 RepID=A0A143WU60_9ENTR|nr:signal recognition particle-docking protein FtsY [Candidatus Hoaglandella endobia]CUX97228.1 Signal recognition particle receptor FtsY [Candidatus Hoaglandella endobia]